MWSFLIYFIWQCFNNRNVWLCDFNQYVFTIKEPKTIEHVMNIFGHNR